METKLKYLPKTDDKIFDYIYNHPVLFLISFFVWMFYLNLNVLRLNLEWKSLAFKYFEEISIDCYTYIKIAFFANIPIFIMETIIFVSRNKGCFGVALNDDQIFDLIFKRATGLSMIWPYTIIFYLFKYVLGNFCFMIFLILKKIHFIF